MSRRQVEGHPPLPEPLAAPVPDSHCHLGYDAHAQTLPVADAVARARSVNVTRIVDVGCDLISAPEAIETAETYSEVVAAVALHPNEAPRHAERGDLAQALERIAGLATHQRVRAVGETGLDYFRTGPEGHQAQQDSLREHIRLAKGLGKALVIHDRDAHDDVMALLENEDAPERTVFHCFSGDAVMARRAAANGWFLSFAGTVTFSNAHGLREALQTVPLEQVLVETDAPFLTPMPHRGRPNASYLIPLTIRVMAQVIGTDERALCQQVTANTERAFGTW